MKMNKRALGGLIGVLWLMLSAPSAYALSCYKKGSRIAVERISIPAIAVPGDMPAGTRIWESDLITVTAECGDVTAGLTTENVYFYFNPRGPNLDPNYGLAFGVEVFRPVHQVLDNPQQKFDTGYVARRGQWVDVPVSFRLYLKTTVMPNNSPRPIGGNYEGPSTFQAFQFDGVKGVNIHEGRNLRYDLTNLNNIRFLTCGADIVVVPNNQDVDFGTISATAFNDNAAVVKDFTLRAIRRGCGDHFTIDMRLDPKTPTVDNQHLDLQNGLQISVLSAGQRVEFGKYYPFGTLGVNATIDKSYQAKLTKIPGRDLQLGPFRAGLVYRINYK